MRCSACNTENTVRDGAYWACSCGWICPILSEGDTPVSLMERLDLCLDRLRDLGMPCTQIRLGPAARALYTEWFRSQPSQRITLDNGEQYELHAIRYRNIVVTTHATGIEDLGRGRSRVHSDDDWYCNLGVNQARPLAPRWLSIGMRITNGVDSRTVETVDMRRGIATTNAGPLTFEQLRDEWRVDRAPVVLAGQLWNESSASTPEERRVPWRVQRVGAMTAHLVGTSAGLRIVPLEDLIGRNPLYTLTHDVTTGTRVQAVAPRDPVAPALRPRAPYAKSSYDILSDDEDFI